MHDRGAGLIPPSAGEWVRPRRRNTAASPRASPKKPLQIQRLTWLGPVLTIITYLLAFKQHSRAIHWFFFFQYGLLITVKASNFGPHGNFGPFLARSVASLGEFCVKNEQNRLRKSKVCLNCYYIHFPVGRVLIIWIVLLKHGPKFPWDPKLEALTVSTPELNSIHVQCAIRAVSQLLRWNRANYIPKWFINNLFAFILFLLFVGHELGSAVGHVSDQGRQSRPIQVTPPLSQNYLQIPLSRETVLTFQQKK